jgi:hypothetical protein
VNRRPDSEGERDRVGRSARDLERVVLPSGRHDPHSARDSAGLHLQHRSGHAPAEAGRQSADEVVDRHPPAPGHAEDAGHAGRLAGRDSEREPAVAGQRLDDQDGLGVPGHSVETTHSDRRHRSPL